MRGGMLKKKPDFLKISYRGEIFKLKPVPNDFQELQENVSEIIPNSPLYPLFNYEDDHGDVIQIINDRGLQIYYSDLLTNPNLIIRMQVNVAELATKLTNESTQKTGQEDIINLSIFGLISMNYEVLHSVTFDQSSFGKTLINEILLMVKESSMEEVAEKFSLP